MRDDCDAQLSTFSMRPENDAQRHCEARSAEAIQGRQTPRMWPWISSPRFREG
jgi:hypothetical protein